MSGDTLQRRNPVGVCVFGTWEGLTFRGTGCFSQPSHATARILDLRTQRMGRNEVLWFSIPAASGGVAVRIIGRVGYTRDYKGRDGILGACLAVPDPVLLASGYSGAIYTAENLYETFVRACVSTDGSSIDFGRADDVLARFPIDKGPPLEVGELELIRMRLPRDWFSYISLPEFFRVVPTHHDFAAASIRGFVLRDHDAAEVDLDVSTRYLQSWSANIFGQKERTDFERHLAKTHSSFLEQKKRADDLVTDNVALAKNLEKQNQSIGQLQNQIKSLGDDLRSANDNCKLERGERERQTRDYERELGRVKSDLETARTALTKATETANARNGELEKQLKTAKTELTTVINQANSTIKTWETDYNGVRAERDKLKSERDTLQLERDELQQSLASRPTNSDVTATQPVDDYWVRSRGGDGGPTGPVGSMVETTSYGSTRRNTPSQLPAQQDRFGGSTGPHVQSYGSQRDRQSGPFFSTAMSLVFLSAAVAGPMIGYRVRPIVEAWFAGPSNGEKQVATVQPGPQKAPKVETYTASRQELLAERNTAMDAAAEWKRKADDYANEMHAARDEKKAAESKLSEAWKSSNEGWAQAKRLEQKLAELDKKNNVDGGKPDDLKSKDNKAFETVLPAGTSPPPPERTPGGTTDLASKHTRKDPAPQPADSSAKSAAFAFTMPSDANVRAGIAKRLKDCGATAPKGDGYNLLTYADNIQTCFRKDQPQFRGMCGEYTTSDYYNRLNRFKYCDTIKMKCKNQADGLLTTGPDKFENKPEVHAVVQPFSALVQCLIDNP